MEKVLSWRDTKPHYDPLGGSQEDKYPDSTLFSLLLLLLLLLSRFSCVRLCATPIEGGPPGFPVPGILQARTLEWVAISFSNA